MLRKGLNHLLKSATGPNMFFNAKYNILFSPPWIYYPPNFQALKHGSLVGVLVCRAPDNSGRLQHIIWLVLFL